jgi:hypothetical protein
LRVDRTFALQSPIGIGDRSFQGDRPFYIPKLSAIKFDNSSTNATFIKTFGFEYLTASECFGTQMLQIDRPAGTIEAIILGK